jgi:hypothetical protein
MDGPTTNGGGTNDSSANDGGTNGGSMNGGYGNGCGMNDGSANELPDGMLFRYLVLIKTLITFIC